MRGAGSKRAHCPLPCYAAAFQSPALSVSHGSLRGSYARSARYGHVLGSAETYSVEQFDGGLFFNLEKAGDGRMGMLLSNEASMSAVDTISREVSTGSFVPLAVHFKHAPRGDISVYEAHFGCPVHFKFGRDALLVSEESIDAPNRLGDKTIAGFLIVISSSNWLRSHKTVTSSFEYGAPL